MCLEWDVQQAHIDLVLRWPYNIHQALDTHTILVSIHSELVDHCTLDLFILRKYEIFADFSFKTQQRGFK